MINYLDYLNSVGLPSTGTVKGDQELVQKHWLYTQDKPLSGTDPIGIAVVADRVFKPVELLRGAIKPGIKALKALRKSGQSDDILQNIYTYIGGHKPGPSVTSKSGILSAAEKEQIQLLQDAGVDLSKISIDDLTTMLQKRSSDIMESAPERFNVVNKTDGGWNITDGSVVNGKLQTHGKTKLVSQNGDISISNMTAYDNAGKVSERAYNTAVQTASQNGYTGIVSGDNLISTPKTYKVWEHFPDKEIVRTNGVHSNTIMVDGAAPHIRVGTKDGMLEATSKNVHATNPNGAVVRIKSKSDLPTAAKSTTFNPTIIDKNGKMQIDWADPDLFKAVVPISLLSLGQDRSANQTDN